MFSPVVYYIILFFFLFTARCCFIHFFTMSLILRRLRMRLQGPRHSANHKEWDECALIERESEIEREGGITGPRKQAAPKTHLNFEPTQGQFAHTAQTSRPVLCTARWLDICVCNLTDVIIHVRFRTHYILWLFRTLSFEKHYNNRNNNN